MPPAGIAATFVPASGSHGCWLRCQVEANVSTADHALEVTEIDNSQLTDVDLPPNLQVLLAEDNQLNQKFATRALQKAGHSVDVACNGEQAVEAWRAIAFDVVLMDIQMPLMDGYEATAQIRQMESAKRRHTPIIAMTGHATTADKQKCFAAGMDGHVSKPVTSNALLAEIARVLNSLASSGGAVSSAEQIDGRT